MADSEGKIIEYFDIQNDMIRSTLDVLLDTLPVISDSVQQIASAVAGGTGSTGKTDSEGEGKDEGQGQAANVDFKKLADSLGGISKGLLEFNVIAGGGTKFVKFIKGLTKALTMDGELKNPSSVAELYSAFGKSIKNIGESLVSMSLGMMLFSVASALGGPAAFTKFFDEFFTKDRLKSLSGKDAKSFGKNLVAISSSIKTMAITLALMTPAMIIAIPGLLLLIPAMLVIKFAMNILGGGDSIKQMKGFTKSMTWLGVGIATFVIAAIATRLIQPTDLLMLGLVVGAYAITSIVFTFVNMITGGGSVSEKAAKGIVFMSIGLLAFELAALGTRLITIGDIGKVLLISIVLSMSAIILSAVSNKVENGAKAMIMIAGSIIVAELAVWLIQVLDLQPKSYMIAAAIVITLVGAAYIAGIKAATAQKGAGAMILVGISLVVAAFGVKMLDSVEWETLGKGAALITGLGLAAAAVGLVGPAALIGAGAMLVIGVAVLVMAKGIKEFEDMDGKKIQDNIKHTIGATFKEFAKVSLLAPLALVGSAAGLAVGAALIVIGKGLKNLVGLDIDVASLSGKDGHISKLLNSVFEPFVEIGKQYTFGSITSFLTGGGNPLADGINASKGIVDVLCDIASGVKAFSKLEFKNAKGEVITMADGDFDKVAENLKKVITCVSDAFISVGRDNQYDMGATDTSSLKSGLMSFVNNMTGNTPLQNAIRNFSGVGEVLNEIASGLKSFSELKFGEKTFDSSDFGPEGLISKNIKNVIMCVAQAFVGAWDVISPGGEGGGILDAAEKIASGDVLGAIGSLGDTPLEKAIASFSGISEISSGIIDIVDKLVKNAGGIDSETIKKNISNVISGMTGGLVGINAANLDDLNARKEYIKDVSGAIVNIAKNSDGLKASADAMEKICNSLDKSFNTIKELADEKLKNVKEVFDALVKLEEKESTRIAEKMDKFGDMVNGNSASSSNSGATPVGYKIEGSKSELDSNNDSKIKNTDILKQIAEMSQMLNEISTKLSGTLSVNVEDAMGYKPFNR